MASTFTNEVIVVIRNADKAAAESAYDTDLGAGVLRHFRVPLSTTGNLPAQAWAARLLITPAMRTKIQDRASELSQTRYYRISATTGNLLSTNSASAQASVGQPWDFAQALSDLGLQEIRGTP